MGKRLFITGTHLFPSPKRKIFSTLIRGAQSLFAPFYQKALSENDAGFLSQSVFKQLKNVKKGFLPYFWKFVEFREAMNFKELHNYEDSLVRFAHQKGEASGLVYKGVSVFETTTLRWLDPLLNSYLVYIDLLLDAMSSNVEKVTLPASSSFQEKVTALIAKKKNIPVSYALPPGIRTLLDFLQRYEERTKSGNSYQNIIGEWKKFTLPTPEFKPNNIPPKSKKRLLFVAYKERTLRRLEVLAPYLKEQFEGEVWLATLYRGKNLEADLRVENIEKHGVKIIWADSVLSREDVTKVLNDVQVKLKLFSKENPQLPSLVYKEIDLASETSKLIRDTMYEGSLVSSLELEWADQILSQLHPDLIVHFEEWEINRCLSILGHTKKIPSLSYYHLSPSGYCSLLRRVPDFLASSGSFLANAYCSEANWERSKIRITGDPLVDGYASVDRAKAKKETCAKWGLNSNKPILLLISTYADEILSADDLKKFFSIGVDIAQKLGMQLVVKAHPQQDEQAVREEFLSLGASNPTVILNADLVELAAAADLALITFGSSSSQVMLARTPLVSFQNKAIQTLIDIDYEYKKGAGIPVLDFEEDYLSVCHALINDPVHREKHIEKAYQFVEKHVGPVDGLSKKRFVNYVNELIG